MSKRIFAMTAILLTATASIAYAAPKADLNGDEQVSRAEFMAAATSRFVRADANGDGVLTKDEKRDAREGRRDDRSNNRFAKLDANGDGFVSEAEYETARATKDAKRNDKRDARRAEMLERFDTNVDGELSETERAAAKAEREAKRGERRAEREASGETRGKRGKRGKMRANPDLDGDGVITRAEYETASEQMFIRLDANGDGVLTKGEGRKGKGKRGGRRG